MSATANDPEAGARIEALQSDLISDLTRANTEASTIAKVREKLFAIKREINRQKHNLDAQQHNFDIREQQLKTQENLSHEREVVLDYRHRAYDRERIELNREHKYYSLSRHDIEDRKEKLQNREVAILRREERLAARELAALQSESSSNTQADETSAAAPPSHSEPASSLHTASAQPRRFAISPSNDTRHLPTVPTDERPQGYTQPATSPNASRTSGQSLYSYHTPCEPRTPPRRQPRGTVLQYQPPRHAARQDQRSQERDKEIWCRERED